MNWNYNSGGHHKDDKKYKENYDSIFKKPCTECGEPPGQHHKNCSLNWRAKRKDK